MTNENISFQIHTEVLVRCGTKWAEISTALSNDLIDRCDDVEDFIRDIVSEFEGRIKVELRRI